MNEDGLILVVEDNDNDAFLLREAFHRAGILNPLRIVVTAEQATEYLLGNGLYASRRDFPLPSIIFTDLHLPRTSGLSLVRWIKSQPSLAEIPVVVMSGSDGRETREAAYEAGANLVLSKPAGQEELVQEVRLACEHLLVA